jgi:hypothetical protein
MTRTTAMLRNLAGLLVLALIVVQSAAFLHVAAHGFAEHKHHGKICEVYEYCDQMVLADGPVMAAVALLLVVILLPLTPFISLISTNNISAARPRAPPFWA